MENFENKEVFITGASRGIGKVIAETFAGKGAIVTAPSREELDLSKADSVIKYIDNNKDCSYDIMVFCAGINNKAPVELITYDDLIETYQVNLFSSIQLLSHYIKKMKSRNRGKIVFISSLYAVVSREERIPYCSSKNAITGLVKTTALEVAEYNICVNAVAPGYVLTDMTEKNLSTDEIEEIKKLIPTHRFQMPEEIAEIVLFLCSDRNKSITGQLIAVDGGFLCR